MSAVLIVDDDHAVNLLLRTILEREGYTVTAASNGRDALALLTGQRFAAIILDLMMPVLSGYDFLGQLDVATCQQTVIVLTAASELHLRAVDPSSVRMIIRKPFDLTELVAAVRTVAISEGSSTEHA